MTAQILLVDDDPMILSSLRRQLRGLYEVDTEEDPNAALMKVGRTRYSTVVSDFRMPKMNGIEFLKAVRVKSPDTTRVMLTGFADLENAMGAVNQGHVFRFLTKPCEKDLLIDNLAEAVKQYELVTAKKELLEKTLKGSIELLGEITSLVNPEAYARINRVKRYVRYLAEKKGVKDIWRYEVATMLSQIGCVILPPELMEKLLSRKAFSAEDMQMFEMHPAIAQSLISKLPRLEAVGEMVAYQLKGFDGSGTPRNNIKEESIPLGGRILRLALDYDMHIQREKGTKEAYSRLEEHVEQYDPELLYYLEGLLGVEAHYEVKKLDRYSLEAGMILHEDVLSQQGAMLLRKSLELDKNKIDRIHMFAEKVGIQEPITVLVSN